MNLMYRNGADTYRQTSILTADSKRLVLMCYEGAITNLKIAKERALAREHEAKAKALEKVHGFIGALREALDFNKGGQIATNLDAIYRYMLRQIVSADINKNMKGFDDISGMLEELKEAWEEIFYGKNEHAVGTPASHAWCPPAKEGASTGYGLLGRA